GASAPDRAGMDDFHRAGSRTVGRLAGATWKHQDRRAHSTIGAKVETLATPWRGGAGHTEAGDLHVPHEFRCKLTGFCLFEFDHDLPLAGAWLFDLRVADHLIRDAQRDPSQQLPVDVIDRKSTRLNSSHVKIS